MYKHSTSCTSVKAFLRMIVVPKATEELDLTRICIRWTAAIVEPAMHRNVCIMTVGQNVSRHDDMKLSIKMECLIYTIQVITDIYNRISG